MKLASITRLLVLLTTITALAGSVGGIVLSPQAEAAQTPYQAAGELNVRATPSTKAKLLATLKRGDVVLVTGKANNGWLPISFNNSKAYVVAKFVKKSSSKNPAVTGIKGYRKTTANVNMRGAASLNASIAQVLPKGYGLEVTGRSSGDFTEVKAGGKLRFVYTQFLEKSTTQSAPATQPKFNKPVEADTAPPSTAAIAKTTAVLALRQQANLSSANLGNVPAGASIALSGVHSGAYSQATYEKKTGWLLTGYFTIISTTSSGITTTSIPQGIGKRYVNASAVNLRSASNAEGTIITKLAFGTLLVTTGAAENSYTPVIWDGAVRWIASQYIQTNAISANDPGDLGSSSLNKLQPYAKAAVIEVWKNFPQVATIGGWRSSSAYSSDHPNGRAIDIMIPSYKTNKALGDAIATWVIANADRLHVKYLIWRQRNYTLTRGKWVAMADRGSDTQNHMDHVHVSFYDS